nr:hypothetical protein [uncultured Butyrivibrio sp.]
MKKSVISCILLSSLLFLASCGNDKTLDEIESALGSSTPKATTTDKTDSDQADNAIDQKETKIEYDGLFDASRKVSKITIEKNYRIYDNPNSSSYRLSYNMLTGTTVSEYNSKDVLLRIAYYSPDNTVYEWEEAVEFDSGNITTKKRYDADGTCTEENHLQYDGDDVVYSNFTYHDGSSYEIYYENGNVIKSISTSSDGIVKEHTTEIEHIDSTTDKELRYTNGELTEYVVIEKNEKGETLSRSRYKADGTFVESNIYNPDEPDNINTHTVETYSGSTTTHETTYAANGRIAKKFGYTYGYDEDGRVAIELDLGENDNYLRGWNEYEYRDVSYKYEHVDLRSYQPYDLDFTYVDYDNHNKSLLKSIKRTDKLFFGGGSAMYFDNDNNTNRVMISDSDTYEETYKYDYGSNGLPAKGYIYNQKGDLIYELTYDDNGSLIYQDSNQVSPYGPSEYEADMSSIDYSYAYQYNSDGLKTKMEESHIYLGEVSSGCPEKYYYDKHGRLVYTERYSAVDPNELIEYTVYAYSDQYGLLAKIIVSEPYGFTQSTTYFNGKAYYVTYSDYTYRSGTIYNLDEYGQVISYTSVYQNGATEVDEFTYDEFGNCIEHKNNSVDIHYEYYEKGDKKIPLKKIYYPEMP